ncbi:hypothetical protein [Hyphomonas sp.]|uniref:hypothetical protein n=1 Tax=Hyphomonas sp. TaxID=87 RepID=UPI0025C1B222|nr:hypothetical protein [Hyphomonas sp.]
MGNDRQLAKTGRALVFASLFGLLASPALAQASGYDANCDPRNYTADEMVQQELCSAHVGCRLTQKAMTSACKVKDFFSNLGGALSGRSTPDNMDVLEALNRSEVPQTSGVKSTNASARPYYEGARLPSYDRTNAAQISMEPPVDGKPSGSLNWDKDGTVRWFEGTGARNASKQLSGNGVQIDSTGRIRAGILIDDAIGGGGIARTPDASWAGGNFKSGRLEGDGYQLKSDGTGNAPVLEGTFKDNQPDGMMLATYPDFSSRKELWKDGKLIVAGPKVAKGQVPPTPKSPQEEAAEKAAAEAAAFAAQLSSEKNPGALYALGDEWAEKGDMAKAKSAWRELIKRFPDSPFAIKATDRLSGGGAASTSRSSPSAETFTGTVDFTGVWVGESTGNRVEVDFKLEGISIVAAGPRAPGQAEGTQLFRVQSPGVYVHTFSDGMQATIRMEGPDRLRITNPDGWNDLFVKGGTRSATVQSAACTGSPSQAFAAFNNELEGFNARYPVQPQWGTRDLYKFSIFFGTESLKILEKYRGCMSESDFTTNWNALNGSKETGMSGCRATSSDGGRGCVAEYP